MALIAKAGSGSGFTAVPAGMHLARCYKIVDLGTQKSEYMGKPKIRHMIMVQWEIWSEDADGKPTVTSKGEPMSIAKNYNNLLEEKASLRIDLKTWRGRDFTSDELAGFELKNILGVWAMLSIVCEQGRDGKDYTNVQAVMPVPPNIKKAGLPTPHNPLMIYEIAEHDDAVFETLSDHVKKKITESPEFQSRKPHVPADGGFGAGLDDDDIPF